MLQDLKYAFRTLIKNPGFTAVAVITLGLGIGANTAIFSLINALILRPPVHVRQPEHLIAVYTSDFSGPPFGTSSYADFVDFKAQASDVIADASAQTARLMSLSTGSENTRAFGQIVTGNYFQMLGTTPVLGRGFVPDEDVTPGAKAVVVISHDLWQRAYAGDPGVIGRTLRLNGTTFSIVGVAPAGFSGLLRGVATEVWVPIRMNREVGGSSETFTNRGDRGWFITARLVPGATPAMARSRFAVIARQLHEAYPESWTDMNDNGRIITTVPESETRLLPQLRTPALAGMGLLMAVVGLVLLICCANVANLLLARASARHREIAIRVALGASRGRLLRQLLTESALLAGAGAALGMLIATWTTDLAMAFKPPVPVTILIDLSPDIRVLTFVVFIAVVTGVVFGLIPAMRASRPDLIPALKAEPAKAGLAGRRFGLRNVLVVTQVTVSFVLLIVAGLFLRSLRNATTMDTGFNSDNLALATSDLSLLSYTEARGRAFYSSLEERVRSLPGVRSTSLARSVPLGLSYDRRGIQIPGRERKPGEDMEFGWNAVGPDYFPMMQIPIARGRSFNKQDRPGTSAVAIVNETFANHFWPGANALGKTFSNGEVTMEIVGVARDSKYGSLSEENRAYFYVPYEQQYDPGMTLHVRTTSEPARLLGSIRREAGLLDSALPVQITTMNDHMAVSLLPQRVGATLLGVFGLLGLGLAAVGLYGVMAYAVSRRTREIGIRMALGANAIDVRRMVVRQGMLLAATGIGIGLALSLAVTRLTTGFLYGISASDPITYAGIGALLAMVAFVASYIPARRATRVDPIAALRYE
ncbi:MAG: ABC transporter permease [Anaerolineae bacterium]|nr:ABC transporter permease [Gemmatimonadaceae bacterium]